MKVPPLNGRNPGDVPQSEEASTNASRDLRSQYGRDRISDLRKLARRGADKYIVVREGLESSTFSNAKSSRYLRMQVRSAAPFSAASNNRLSRQCRVKPIDPPKMVALTIV
jgi:hypothetical protein